MGGSSSSSIYPRRVIDDVFDQRQSGFVFILQPINPNFDDVLEAIKAVGSAMSLNVERADDIKEPGAVLTQVVRNMCRAEVVIADLTDTNPNVFYEVGIGHAIREDMILLTQDIQSVPFDLRHLRLVEYSMEDLDSLRSDLSAAVDEVRALPAAARGLRPLGRQVAGATSSLLEERSLSDPARSEFGINADSTQLAIPKRECTADGCSPFVIFSLVPSLEQQLDQDQLWGWLTQERSSSEGGTPVSGDEMRPRGRGIIILEKAQRSQNEGMLSKYSLFLENTYVEWGLSLGGCVEKLCIVRLTPLLSALGKLLKTRIRMRDAYSLGPDTLFVSIANAGFTVLSHLGDHWAEPWDTIANFAPTCSDRHVQIELGAPRDPNDVDDTLRTIDLRINRHYNFDGNRGFNHPDSESPGLLNAAYAERDPWAP